MARLERYEAARFDEHTSDQMTELFEEWIQEETSVRWHNFDRAAESLLHDRFAKINLLQQLPAFKGVLKLPLKN